VTSEAIFLSHPMSRTRPRDRPRLHGCETAFRGRNLQATVGLATHHAGVPTQP